MRDSQNFVQAAERGMGICELPPYKVRKDIEQLDKIIEWLDGWQERRRDPAEKRRIEQASNVALFRKPGVGNF